MLLSIIIPLYNGEKTISRLLKSIQNQYNFNLDDIEIIICNDNSTDKSVDLINDYWINKFKNIKIIDTEKREIHSPGNTRHDALPQAKGEWVTFIDCDDEFEEDFLYNSFNFIKSRNITKVMYSKVREWDFDLNEPSRIIPEDELKALLHGKIYNREWLKKHNINFKLDMYLLEDLYFNVLVENAIYLDNDIIYTFDNFTYRWGYYKESFSHNFYGAEGPSSYHVRYMKGFLTSGIYPYFNIYKNVSISKDKKDYIKLQLMCNILHSYFYIQDSLYHNDFEREDYVELCNFFRKVLIDIEEELGITKKDIIIYIYQNPDRYYRLKNKCKGGKSYFIELTSFSNYIEQL